MASSKTLLVTTVKDEGPNILEWVAHHRVCGFDTIFVYQNGSTDLTVRALRTLDSISAIRFFNNSSFASPQIRAYARAAKESEFEEADYCLALDDDEFFRCDLPGTAYRRSSKRQGTPMASA